MEAEDGGFVKLLSRLILLIIFLLLGYTIYIKTNGLIPAVDPDTKLVEFVNKKKWTSVKMYSEFILRHPWLGDTAAARRYLNKANSEIKKAHSFKGRFKSFLRGAMTGEPRNIDELIGSLTLDLFVIGDIRDIIMQLGVKPIFKKEKPDPLITALAAIGVITTTNPGLDVPVSVMKLFKKLKIFTKRFAKVLETIARDALKTRKFDKLKEIVKDFGKILRKTDISPTADLMKYVDDTKDLKKLSKVVEKEPIEAYGVIVTTDGKALKLLKGEAKDASKLAKILENTARFARLTKIGYKMLNSLPLWLLYVLVMFTGLVLLLDVLSSIRRVFRG